MPWVKLDDGFYDHRKTVAVGTLGAGLFTMALSYCARQLTDGFVAAAMIRRLAADVDDPIALAETLADAGYFERREGGYQIHAYLEYNPSRAKVLKDREEAKARMQAVRGAKEGKGGEQTIPAEECSPEVHPNAAGSSPSPVPSPVPVPTPVPGPEAQNLGGDVAPPSPPPERQRKRSAHDDVRLALELHFSQKTRLPRPEVETDKQKRAAASLWYGPLRDIAELAAWDVGEATRLVDAALAQLDGHCTIASPKSIASTALAIHTGNAGGNGARASPEPGTRDYTGGKYGHLVKH